MGIFSMLFKNENSSKLPEVIREGAFLVDVRTPAEFSTGTVKGAVNIPLDTLGSQISRFRNKGNIVVFCRSGNRSAEAKNILDGHGIRNVTNGGDWQQVNKIVNQ